MLTEQDEATAELARHQHTQSELRAVLPAPDLALYDQLRRRKAGLAVVELNGSMCSACGVRPAAHVMQQINQTQIARCGNCERILVKL
jgi:predicted  nucleic acid-binding Zn-ribbon protein